MSWDAEGARRLRSAVLVDAENMYLGLQSINPAAASAFVTSPDRWLHWLSKLMYPQIAGNVQRDFLVRACYLNPSQGAPWRTAFVQAGFQVIDCPTLTWAGKNSADIQMVIAMLDLLAHPTHFDEIVVMSSDADFSPALTRIRTHDRRTVVIASGPYSPALTASCDHLVPAGVFAQEALSGPGAAAGLPVGGGVVGLAAVPLAAEPGPVKTAKRAVAKKTVSKKTAAAQKPAAPAEETAAAAELTAATKKTTAAAKTSAKKATAKKTAASKTAASDTSAGKSTAGKTTARKTAKKTASLPADARSRATQAVLAIVEASATPVVLASLATPVRSALGPDLSNDYDGASSLKKLLQQLDLPGLEVGGGGPGYLYDPARHPSPPE